MLSVLVENKPGVLTRVAGLFARRGFNIDTLTVGPTEDEHVSRMTITVDGAMHPIDQVTKQLHKLVNVLKIRDLEPRQHDRSRDGDVQGRRGGHGSLRGDADRRDLPRQGRSTSRSARSCSRSPAHAEKIDAFERMVRPFGLIEMMRTGEIAISRGRDET